MKPTDFITGKVTYDREGQYFWINKNGGLQMLAELRGWGAIQNLFKAPLAMEKAGNFQDQIGQFIADAINEKIEREKP